MRCCSRTGPTCSNRWIWASADARWSWLRPHGPGGVTPRVATKYERTTRRFFASRGIQVEVVRLSGSVEIAPLLGMTHWIVDLVETGRTLRENGLRVVDTIAPSSARLILNRASHKLRLEEHQRLVAELAEVCRGRGDNAPKEPTGKS
jgi:ATP phosphoribosyltransferase